ncbi:type II secretion system F family protein [Streptomyces sp. NPDC015220]|uniref:type II secretion system F family protein n=1 Tax=Streptomyces sp. NPDC015220 TaxID=3364947 RepID=UPI0036FC8F94
MSAEVVHRLGTAVVVAVLLWLTAQWPAAVRRERRARRRLNVLLEPGADARAEGAGLSSSALEAVRRWAPAAGVLGAGWVLVGGLLGVSVGLVCAAGTWRWRQLAVSRRPQTDFDVAEAARQLPLAADLVAACIASGAGPVIAAQAVGQALGGAVGEALARGAAEVRLGGAPAEAWHRLASIPGAAGLARLLARADESGLPAAGPVARLAADVRADRARAATARARRAAVLVTGPVGLCFLPAFVAVGVLPVVIGLAGGVLGGGGGR